MITSSSNGMVTINFHNFNHRTHQQSSLINLYFYILSINQACDGKNDVGDDLADDDDEC